MKALQLAFVIYKRAGVSLFASLRRAITAQMQCWQPVAAAAEVLTQVPASSA